MRGGAARWWPPLLWAAAVFFASSQPTLPHLPSVLGWDKLQHSAAYGVGGFLIARALGGGWRGALLAALLGSLYGASDEANQYFVPNRTPDVLDWMADTLGVTAGACLWRLHRSRTHAPPTVNHR